MPPIRSYRDNKRIYSVDMMIAYVNIFKHPIESIPIEEFHSQLTENIWGERTPLSPMQVIEKIDLKKYSSNAERIHKADLSYPIFVDSAHRILDGYHRVSKAYIEDKKNVRAYVFDAELMKKFILVKDLNFVKLNSLSIYEILELWSKNFC
jgi:hypothetical protein